MPRINLLPWREAERKRKRQEFILSLRQDHYAGPGDLFLFGCVLDHFLGCYASINHFTRTTVREVMKGDVYRWPARIGNRPLI